MTHYIEFLKQLISQPSCSREETAVADMMEQELRDRGFLPHRIGNNVWAKGSSFDEGKPTVLLNAHLDTVRPVSAWVRSPFEPLVEGDRLYGLGSNDCGGGLVALLETFTWFSSHPCPYNLVYLASAEEEVTGVGGIRLALPELPPIDVAIVGEPTSLQPAVCERGLLVLDMTAHGKSGHAAREEGVNALYLAIDDINRLRNFQFPKVSQLLGAVKMTTTIIEAGTQHNVVPDVCKFTVDVRINDCYTNLEVLDIIRQLVKSDVQPRSTHLNSSHISLDHPLVQKAVGLGLKPFGSPTMSDQTFMPFPSFKLGPGDSARSHTADEYILMSDIGRAIEIYRQLLS